MGCQYGEYDKSGLPLKFCQGAHIVLTLFQRRARGERLTALIEPNEAEFGKGGEGMIEHARWYACLRCNHLAIVGIRQSEDDHVS